MDVVQVHNISFDELRKEMRALLREELKASKEETDIWVAGEKDAAQMLGLSVGWLSKMVQGGKLEGCYARIGEKKLNFNITKIRNVMSNK